MLESDIISNNNDITVDNDDNDDEEDNNNNNNDDEDNEEEVEEEVEGEVEIVDDQRKENKVSNIDLDKLIDFKILTIEIEQIKKEYYDINEQLNFEFIEILTPKIQNEYPNMYKLTNVKNEREIYPKKLEEIKKLLLSNYGDDNNFNKIVMKYAEYVFKLYYNKSSPNNPSYSFIVGISTTKAYKIYYDIKYSEDIEDIIKSVDDYIIEEYNKNKNKNKK